MTEESKICEVLDCPYAKVTEIEKQALNTRLQKLTDAMELIKQAYSFNMQEIMSVMGNLYDYVIQNYPDRAKLIKESDDDCNFNIPWNCEKGDEIGDFCLLNLYRAYYQSGDIELEFYDKDVEE